MKTMYDAATLQEILSRVDALDPSAKPAWGKMNASQMLAHCNQTLRVVTGKMNLPRTLIGRILGPMVRSAYVGETPLRKNSPTNPEFVITDTRDFAKEKEFYKALVKEFHEGGEAKCTRHPHSFFGPLTPEEWGRTTYKHLDHHLSQFGA